jgi:hypothetical protein
LPLALLPRGVKINIKWWLKFTTIAKPQVVEYNFWVLLSIKQAVVFKDYINV